MTPTIRNLLILLYILILLIVISLLMGCANRSLRTDAPISPETPVPTEQIACPGGT